MSRDVSLYVRDILENMERAEEFLRDMTFEEFRTDIKTSYAIVRCLEIIGEASKGVPTRIRKKYPAVPWKDMAGMRDVISHMYFGIDTRKVWRTVKEDIPKLKPHIAAVLEDISEA